MSLKDDYADFVDYAALDWREMFLGSQRDLSAEKERSDGLSAEITRREVNGVNLHLALEAERAKVREMEWRAEFLGAQRDEARDLANNIACGGAWDAGVAEELAQREQQDLEMVMRHCSVVYMHLSGGRISKPNTFPEEVIALGEERDQQEIERALVEERESGDWAGDLDQLIKLRVAVTSALEALRYVPAPEGGTVSAVCLRLRAALEAP